MATSLEDELQHIRQGDANYTIVGYVGEWPPWAKAPLEIEYAFAGAAYTQGTAATSLFTFSSGYLSTNTTYTDNTSTILYPVIYHPPKLRVRRTKTREELQLRRLYERMIELCE